MDMVAVFGMGLVDALSWPNAGFIMLGVVLGLVVGVIPGLGGVVGLTMLLPLTFTMDAGAALAMIIALAAVTSTSDTIPAILMGVPGTSAAAATVVDGYPMAKRGEASRALSASYVASAIGGVFGALVLVLSIPILRPVILAFGPPEIFMLAMVGLVTVGTLGGHDPLRGWAAGAVGVLLAMVGRDAIHATPRFSFGQPFLWDGLPIVAMALGLFALPELVDLSRNKRSISRVELPKNLWPTQIQGARDVLANWFMLLRCSALGTWIGFLPGLGANVADWIAYSHAKATEKNSSTFGYGDVRGVIAPESANNSCKGGELMPTLAFGVPGSLTMAILLGAMLIVGVNPGRELLTTRIDVTMLMIWSLVLANLLGAAICFGLTRYIARLTAIPGVTITAATVPIIIISTYAFEGVMFHILILIGMGVLGYFMRCFNWPRPPVLVGFILGGIVESNLVNSVRLFGWEFMTRPVTLILLLLLIISFGSGLWTSFRKKNETASTEQGAQS